MGIFEAGFVPGCAYLIGSYYKRDEFLRRYTVFFSAAILAGAFNGLFATLLAMADGADGLKGELQYNLHATIELGIVVHADNFHHRLEVDLHCPRHHNELCQHRELLLHTRLSGADEDVHSGGKGCAPGPATPRCGRR